MAAVGALVREYVRAQSAALRTSHLGPEDPVAVHRTRVAARRLRSVLGSCSSVAPDTGGLRHELRWLGSVFADLRQLDVLAAAFPDDADLLGEIGRQRSLALEPAREQLAGVRVSHVLVTLDQLVDCEGWSELPGELVARRVVSRELERVLARAEVAHPPGPDHEARLHDVRKAAKRLRYTAEALASDLPSAAEVARRAKRLQEVLGTRHDRVAAQRWVEALALDRPDLAQRVTVPPEEDLTTYDEALGALLR